MRILHVDDEPSLLEQSKIFLERLDSEITVDTAESPEKALDLLECDCYDAVVSDYQMPEMDGLDFLRELRIWENNDIPFIMFTGKGREEVAMEALNLGADRYLQKGGSPKSQYHVLYQALEQEVEHWHTKSKLQSTEKKYMDLAEKSLVGIYVIQNDVFKYVNPEFSRIFGYSRDELIGKEFMELVHEDDRELVKDGVKERMQGSGEAKKYTFKALTKSGKKIQVRVFSVPSTYQGNNAVQGTLIDITEQQKVKNELEKKNKRLSTIIKNLPGMAYVCEIDENWTMRYVSKGSKDLTGYGPEDLVDNRELAYAELIEDGHKDNVRRTIKEAVENGEAFQVDYHINTKSGEKKKVWEQGRVVEREGDELLEGLILDFDEIKKLS